MTDKEKKLHQHFMRTSPQYKRGYLDNLYLAREIEKEWGGLSPFKPKIITKRDIIKVYEEYS